MKQIYLLKYVLYIYVIKKTTESELLFFFFFYLKLRLTERAERYKDDIQNPQVQEKLKTL